MENINKIGEIESLSSIYLRTSLDERILALTRGAELISITVLPRILPISYQTIKNQISKGTFPIEIIRFNNKNFVRVSDVVKLIQNAKLMGIPIRKKVGRKSNCERMESITQKGDV